MGDGRGRPETGRSPGRRRVMVVTPLGRGGRGGIDRIMDNVRDRLRAEPPAGLDVSFVTTRGQGHLGASIPLVAAVLLRIAARAVGGGPDIAHVNLSTQGSTIRKLVVTGFLRLMGVPYVLHLHGSGYDAYWAQVPAALSRRIDAMFAGAARILVLGRFWRDLVQARVPRAAGRVAILLNAAASPPVRAGAERGPVALLFLGQVGPRKGVPDLVAALARLPGTAAWRAVIAGDGAVDETRAEVARLGLADRVTLPGWVGPAEVERLLASADILVLPSYEENLPMSVIEGMAQGLAVVTTPVGAVTDILVDGETGLLVPPGDPLRLAEALRRLVEDGALRRRLGEAARAVHREHLEIGAYTRRLVSIWRDVADAR